METPLAEIGEINPSQTIIEREIPSLFYLASCKVGKMLAQDFDALNDKKKYLNEISNIKILSQINDVISSQLMEQKLLTGKSVGAVKYNKTNCELVTCTYFGNKLSIWNMHNLQKIVERNDLDYVAAPITYSQDGNYLAWKKGHWDIGIYRRLDFEQIQRLSGHTKFVNWLEFNPNNNLLASGAGDGVRIWDISSAQCIAQFNTDPHLLHEVKQLVWITQTVVAVLKFLDTQISLFNIETGQEEQLKTTHGDSINSIAFNCEKNQLATASKDTMIHLYDMNQKTMRAVLEGHTDAVEGISYDAGSHRLASCSKDQTIRIWDCEKGKQLVRISGYNSSRICFVLDDQFLVVGGPDSQTYVIDLMQFKLSPFQVLLFRFLNERQGEIIVDKNLMKHFRNLPIEFKNRLINAGKVIMQEGEPFIHGYN
jgi:WD40 repeat protein